MINRSEQAGGRLVVGVRLDDGGTFFSVFVGDAWEAKLIYRDRREAWLLEGDESGGSMRAVDITSLLCSRGVGESYVAGMPPNEKAAPVALAAPEVAEAAVLLNSIPPNGDGTPVANGVIYLDFDGETVQDTLWNSQNNEGADIVAAPPPGLTNAQIERVWKGMAEDYRPFNLNVTTDRSQYDKMPINRRTMVIFTTNGDTWYGVAGGVAYVGVFGSTTWDEPAWVFTDHAGDEADWAEAGAHEAGHTLGLSHDGSPSDGEYYAGHGSGATSWAPIMGLSYDAAVSQWSMGEYAGATNTEDDLAIITGTVNGLGYRADDHSNSTSAATPVDLPGGDAITASGVIETTGDIDVFLVQAATGTISVQAANDPTDPDLDIRLRLLDAGGTQLAVSDSLITLDASLSAAVASGTYFIEVEGVGTGDPNTGYSDYGSLGAYTISGTVPQSSQLAAEILSPAAPAISLPLGSGLLLEGSVTGGSFGWEVTEAPVGGAAVFSAPGALSTRCVFDTAGTFRLRLLADVGGETADDELIVSVEAPGDSQVYANRGPAVDLGPDRGVYAPATVLSPAVSDDGVPAPASLAYSWSLLSGAGSLSATTIEQPTLSFDVAGPVALRLVVFDGEIRTFDEVMLEGRFASEVVLAAGGQGRVMVPVDGPPDGLWQMPGFDDEAWQPGELGVGYDAVKNAQQSIFRPLIGAGLDVQATMFEKQSSCYLRLPFQLASAASVLRLDLRMQYDDGFVAYINGVEVARSNAPAGVPAWNSLAATDRSDGAALSFQAFALSPPPGVLVDGTNVLAVHGLNSAVAAKQLEEDRFLLVPELEAMLAQLPFSTTVAVIDDPAQRGAGDDPDGDGWYNLLEHAFGGDPESGDAVGYFELSSGQKPRLLIPESAPDDVRYEIERCECLDESWVVMATKWGPGDWVGAIPVASVPADPGRVWLEFGADTAPCAFYRLRVSLVVP